MILTPRDHSLTFLSLFDIISSLLIKLEGYQQHSLDPKHDSWIVREHQGAYKCKIQSNVVAAKKCVPIFVFSIYERQVIQEQMSSKEHWAQNIFLKAASINSTDILLFWWISWKLSQRWPIYHPNDQYWQHLTIIIKIYLERNSATCMSCVPVTSGRCQTIVGHPAASGGVKRGQAGAGSPVAGTWAGGYFLCSE